MAEKRTVSVVNGTQFFIFFCNTTIVRYGLWTWSNLQSVYTLLCSIFFIQHTRHEIQIRFPEETGDEESAPKNKPLDCVTHIILTSQAWNRTFWLACEYSISPDFVSYLMRVMQRCFSTRVTWISHYYDIGRHWKNFVILNTIVTYVLMWQTRTERQIGTRVVIHTTNTTA